MKTVFHYHSLEEAEQIKRNFVSWLEKKAHSGNGKLEVLKSISIKKGRKMLINGIIQTGYYLEFKFESNKLMNVYDFTSGNGLTPITGVLSVSELKSLSKKMLKSFLVPHYNSSLLPLPE